MKCINLHKITKSNKLLNDGTCNLCQKIKKYNLGLTKIKKGFPINPKRRIKGQRLIYLNKNLYNPILKSLSFIKYKKRIELDFGNNIKSRSQRLRLERLVALEYVKRIGIGRWSKYRKIKEYYWD